MTFQSFPHVAACLLSLALALIVWLAGPRSAMRRAFALGMAALAARAAFNGLTTHATLAEDALVWQRLALIATALVPGSWFLFALTYARANESAFLARWRSAVTLAYTVPLVLALAFGDRLFLGAAALPGTHTYLLPLGWAGYALYVVLTLGAVLILLHLEWTFRASIGGMRWRLKFMVLGLAGLFGSEIYVFSQTLLFAAVDTSFAPLESGALLISGILVLYSLQRSRRLEVDVYVSATPYYNSLTLLGVSLYLLAVGVLPALLGYLEAAESISLRYFSFFLAVVILSAILLSDWLRQQGRQLVTRAFGRPAFDYRHVWMAFTQRTSSLVDAHELTTVVARVVSETFGAGAVTLWLYDEHDDRLVLGGSTLLSQAEARGLLARADGATLLVRALSGTTAPADLARTDRAQPLATADPAFLRAGQARYVVPLVAGRGFLGLMTVSDRLTRAPFSSDDFELLKTFADQAAASLLHIRLAERLLHAKEMEAFQSLSAFFVHDLKNLASTLSMTIQNLPHHFDDPAFRDDMLRVIAGSVDRINRMCSRLSPLSRQLELRLERGDLGQVVDAALAGLDGSLGARVVREAGPVAAVDLDPEQLQKVVVNLLLNASEAIAARETARTMAVPGEIRVRTESREDGVALSVSDNGCGISEQFLARSLFQPFHTTKQQGLGIGLFHSRRIVEAHRGRMEVESVSGEGSTFRVLLPAAPATPGHER